MENTIFGNKTQHKKPLLSYKRLINIKRCAMTSDKFYSHKKNLYKNKNNNINNTNSNYYTMGNTISDFYYKNPFFYNEKNLNIQLKVLKELEKLDLSQNSISTQTNYNTKSNSPKKIDNKFFINNSAERTITNKKISFMNMNIQFPNFPKIQKKDKNLQIEINDNSIKDDEIKLDKRKKYKSLENSLHPGKKSNRKSYRQKIRENDEYFYKIIFKAKPLFKLEPKFVFDNKLNMIYAENEQQYKKIIEKQYQKLISKGKKVKSKNVAPSIKLKLNETKRRIEFMKGIMDYSYPRFVLSKIKIMQKKLNEHKSKASYLNRLNEMQIRSEEQKKRNKSRRDYLLNCITLLK